MIYNVHICSGNLCYINAALSPLYNVNQKCSFLTTDLVPDETEIL